MIDLILLLIVNCLSIIGIYTSTREGMLLDFIPKYIKVLKKPLYDCPPCMASIHSTYVFVPFVLSYGVSLWWYPVYVLALCGLNKIVITLIENQYIEIDNGS
jgi:hypothetical protein